MARGEISVSPGQSIQAAADAHPPGTTFRIKAGIHRLQQIKPKDGDKFIGERGAILSGAKVLSVSDFVRSSNGWYIGGQTQRLPQPFGADIMIPGYECDLHPEDKLGFFHSEEHPLSPARSEGARRTEAGEAGAAPAFSPLQNATGIAAAYPGDAGIGDDPRVIFVEDFEEKSLDALWQRWESVGDGDGQSFADDVPPGSVGKRSLRMDREKGSGPQLYGRLKNRAGGWGYDRVFARYYVKFDPDCGEIHHFGACLGGNNPSTPWPMVNAGHRTDGAKSFWSGIEPFGSKWVWDYYTYWCEMRGSPPRGQTWGNSFVRDTNLKVEKGRWICVEQMIKLNDPNDSNGEQALWIDGQLVSHLGKGFPKGLWTYDKFNPGPGGQGVRWDDAKGGPVRFEVPDGGAPFEGFRWRTVLELNVNYVWLYIYTAKPAGHRIRVWFDHVVVATEYIGPIRQGEKGNMD